MPENKRHGTPTSVRRRARLALVTTSAFALAVLALALLQDANSQDAPPVFNRIDGAESVQGELVVQFDDIPETQRDAIVASAGATITREMSVDGYVKLAVPAGREEEIGELLAADPAVRSAEEIGYRKLMFTPNDELYGGQWNLDMIQMEAAWDLSTGMEAGTGGAGDDDEGVIVAVLDSGVAYQDYNDPSDGRQYKRAPDLAGTDFVAPFDFFDDDTHANDDNGHGSHVAGTIAQSTNNNIGVAGIAYNARIMPVKVCGDQDGNLETEFDYFCPDDAIAEGILYAVNNGARVINMSFGGDIPLGKGSLHRQALDYARDANVVVVAAAGNGTSDPPGTPPVGRPFLAYPAAIPSVISVGAAGSNGMKTTYSDYGLGEVGNQMDLVAPGGDGFQGGQFIRQNTFAHQCTPGVPVNLTLFGYCPKIGTSQAAAHVSGVAALIRARYPDMSATQVRNLMNCSALDVGNPGVDLQHGNGLVQAYWALVDSDADGTPNCLDATAGVVCNVPLATPSPTPMPSDTPAPTPTETPEATPTETPLPRGVPAGVPPTDTPPPPTDTPPPATDTPSPATDTPAPATDTPVPTDTPAATDTPPPTDTPTPLPTDTPPPTPTATPTEAPTDTTSPTPTPVAPNCGDVDCDLDLDAVDALFILRLVAALEPYASCIEAGDVDCGGAIDAVDALGVLRKLVSFGVGRLPGCPPLGYS